MGFTVYGPRSKTVHDAGTTSYSFGHMHRGLVASGIGESWCFSQEHASVQDTLITRRAHQKPQGHRCIQPPLEQEELQSLGLINPTPCGRRCWALDAARKIEIPSSRNPLPRNVLKGYGRVLWWVFQGGVQRLYEDSRLVGFRIRWAYKVSVSGLGYYE